MPCRVAAVPALLCLVLAVHQGFVPTAGAHDASDTVTVELEELNGSGVHGTAVLTAQGDKTLVVMDVTGTAGDHPDHIHRSTCADPEPNPLYPLTDVVLGQANPQGHSETLVDVPLEELLASPHLILIHKSKDEIGVYVACGDITANATAMPDTGAGAATAGGPVGPARSLAVGATALLALAVGWALRRRTVPGP
jgi:hypothetical protein